jgi:DNA-directed RNA polymerase subunit RPC12/RpoP
MSTGNVNAASDEVPPNVSSTSSMVRPDTMKLQNKAKLDVEKSSQDPTSVNNKFPKQDPWIPVRVGSPPKRTRNVANVPNPKLHVYLHQQQYKCQICGHEFSQKGNLFTHMRIHEDRRPYQCEDCGYAARQMVQLKRHAKHHTFRFQFKCRFCTYSSKMKSTTTKHCSLVHGDLLKALNLNDYD